MPDVKRRTFRQLKHAVQALALEAERQLALLPDHVCKADELALDFDQWFKTCTQTYREDLRAGQLDALQAIDRALAAMSGPRNAELWSERALREAEPWRRVRELARSALEAFNWSLEAPPTHVDVEPGDEQRA